MEAWLLALGEAQVPAKRVAMLAMTDGRNLLLAVSLASRASTGNWIAALHASRATGSRHQQDPDPANERRSVPTTGQIIDPGPNRAGSPRQSRALVSG
jgi:hypothetical protein